MNHADMFFTAIMVVAVAIVLLAALNDRRRERRDREDIVALATAVSLLMAAEARAVTGGATADTQEAEDQETRHWTAQGLHKLGYSMAEARRMAAQVPSGLGLQDALQWCLRNRGGK